MALGIQLDLRQRQQLVMTPQLQQAIKLLQMSNMELREYVEHELEANPILRAEIAVQTAPGAAAEITPKPDPEAPLDARLTPEGDHSLSAETFDNGIENLYDAGHGSAELVNRNSRGGSLSFEAAGIDLEQQPDHPASLREHLFTQIGQCRADAPIALLAKLLVDELDDQGYLRIELDELTTRLGATQGQIEAALALVQGCDPTGVGARNLSECLALQLAERDRLDPAMRIFVDNLGLLERGERRKLQALCDVDDEDFAEMLREIRALDPRPCAGFLVERAETLIPDVLLRRDSAGGWLVELNADTLPKVLIDNRYAARLAASGAEARGFVSECRANANWLIRSLDQRARTILSVATEIVRKQGRFFAEGVTGLEPLTLRMVAEEIGMHESTVSRVTSNKHIATERGIFELKFFFSNAVGESGYTAEAVRHQIRSMVAVERPGEVLSDDEIVERLQSGGVDIARRTVAKYRKVLGIPSSVDRRRLNTMMPGE